MSFFSSKKEKGNKREYYDAGIELGKYKLKVLDYQYQQTNGKNNDKNAVYGELIENGRQLIIKYNALRSALLLPKDKEREDKLISINKDLDSLESQEKDLLSKKGGRKASSVKKVVCGKLRCIYKISGSRKEHLKYKGQLITVAEYKKLMKH
jgi:hypothetical protein